MTSSHRFNRNLFSFLPEDHWIHQICNYHRKRNVTFKSKSLLIRYERKQGLYLKCRKDAYQIFRENQFSISSITYEFSALMGIKNIISWHTRNTDKLWNLRELWYPTVLTTAGKLLTVRKVRWLLVLDLTIKHIK